ncbi:MAG TPA: hypothetical protein PLP29_04110 [Candidatus Ozemobacteraceae bacterium]|nr:hypothetical protein [Candidatus Ozemobacteraceae bacterium]
MNGTTRLMLPLLTILLILGAIPAEASRRSKTEYDRCQDTLQKLFGWAELMSLDHAGFPPPNLPYATDTGEIPLTFFVEQSLVADLDLLRLMQPSCRYAVAPWALPAPERASGTTDDLYCAKHGFLSRIHDGSGNQIVTADAIRSYFISNCTKQGIPLESWKAALDGFDPDVYGLGRANTLPKRFISTLMLTGPAPFLFLQVLTALGGCLVFLRRCGAWRPNIWAGITAGASLWVGFPTLYLFLYQKLAVETMTLQSLVPLRILFGAQEIASLPLFLFFFTMIFVFRKQGRPSGPVILLTFAVVPGVLFTNVLTTIAGLWAFRSLLRSAASAGR